MKRRPRPYTIKKQTAAEFMEEVRFLISKGWIPDEPLMSEATFKTALPFRMRMFPPGYKKVPEKIRGHESVNSNQRLR